MIDYDMIRVMGDVNVDLSLRQVQPTDSYILREADGITAPEFNMQIANTLYQGGVFQNRQSINRQVVLSIRLNPNYGAGETVKSLRQNLYKMLSPRWMRPVKVQLMLAGTVVAEVEGHVSGMPMNPFVKDPEVQVTIDCLSASWFAPTPVNYMPGTGDVISIEYEGSAPVGFAFSVTYHDNINGFQIVHADNALEKIHIDRLFTPNQILTVDTRPGTRSVTLTSAGVTTSLLADYSIDSKWLELYEGVNNFMVSGAWGGAGFTWNGVTYTPQWWGA